MTAENTPQASIVWSGLLGLEPEDLVLNKPAHPSFSSEPGTPRDVAAQPQLAAAGIQVVDTAPPTKTTSRVKIKPDFWEDWFGG